jgi:hypothetical protein
MACTDEFILNSLDLAEAVGEHANFVAVERAQKLHLTLDFGLR